MDINSTEKVSLDEFEFSKEVSRYTQNKQKKANRTRESLITCCSYIIIYIIRNVTPFPRAWSQ